MKTLWSSFPLLFLTATLFAAEKPAAPPPPTAEIVFRELSYDGKVSEDEARFTVEIAAEAIGKGEAQAVLFDGEIALLPPKLPEHLRIERDGNVYRLFVPRPGKYQLKLEVVAKITRTEPWNHVSFQGPSAAIARVTAQAPGADVDLQLLTGTMLESGQTNGASRVQGFLGAESKLALRWQSRAAEITRKAVVAAETTGTAQITPTVIKYATQFRYDVIQGKLPKLTIELPATQALTRLVGEQIRDWSLNTEGEKQTLTIEFIKPIEKKYELTVLSEQTVETTPATVTLMPPQPLDAERELGTLTLATEDMQVEIEAATGLRQVNAPAGSLAAYRFSARPLALTLGLKRIEPVVSASDRVTTRLEETRLVASHALTLNVEKAGIYQIELQPQSGFVVADVRGEGVDDWKVTEGKLRVSFANRVLGARRLDIQLEQALKQFPERFVTEPLRVMGATKETAQVGAASAPGIQLKTAELVGLREMPVNRLPARTVELLAYTSDAADWQLALSAERLSARVIAEIFNLVTIGDGLVGGSATIRYGLINQGVQEFRIKVPVHWKNVEFTGPSIRRKELNGDTWTIGLQDKAWGAYTLVVTYDYQFDPQGATLPIAGLHALEVERETGSIAITTAASLKLSARPIAEPLRRVDEAELASVDRALITRSVLLAYQYTGATYDLSVEVKRYESATVLAAVADRTQLTSVLTEAGELLTQASFMVKNNDKQFQRFLLPTNANFWSCYVNGQPAKPERDGDWLLVPLPRGANRNQAFAVDIVYAEKKAALRSGSQALQLRAPQTDVPNTYAEWQLYVPTSQRVSSFGGSMSVAQGTDYAVLDAWKQFLSFYGKVLREIGPGLILLGFLIVLVVVLVVIAARRGSSGLITALAVLAIMAILGAMLLPALSKAKSKAQRISSVNNLKQIGLAARIFAADNDNRLPVSFEEMMTELNTDKITYDVETGQRYTYLGAGYREDEITPDSVIAYSPMSQGRCNVLFADGSVQIINQREFSEYAQRGFIVRIPAEQLARQEQEQAIRSRQFAGEPAAQRPAAQPVIDSLALGVEAVASTPAPVIAGQSVVTTSGGGGGSGGAMTTWGAAAITPEPKAAGLRSIRIDIPRTGNAFLFTKVLNVRDEPLSVSARIMSLHTFQKRQMIAQAGAFVIGLGLWLWQWRGRRNSLVLTIALALMFGAVSSLLIAWRALHDALIVGFPIVLLAVVSWLSWKFWARRPKSDGVEVESSDPDEPDPTTPPPVVVGLVLAGLLALPFTTQATEPQGVDATRAALPPATANVSVLAASYTGTVNERVAQLDVTIKVNAAQAGQKIALFGEDVAVQSFSAKPRHAQIVRDGKIVSVLLPRKGEATLQLKLLVRLSGDVAKRQLAFAIPAALTSRLALTIDQPDADVEFPGAISFKRATEAQQTRVEALIGAGEKVTLAWTPRVKRAAEMAATVMSQNTSLVSFGGGVMSVRTVLDYQIAQGELRQARVKIPVGQRLLRVEGEAIRTWTTREEEGEPVLVVELLKGMTPNYRLVVETEKSLEAMPASTAVETPHALEVKRETGLVALRAEDELEFSVTRTEEVQRVDPATFAASGTGLNAAGVTSAFRFLKPGFTLETRVAALQSQVEAVVRNHLRVGAEQLYLAATLDYVIKRVGVFALKFAVPEDFRIESVQGVNVLQWQERADAGKRVVEVTLKERTLGDYALRVELVKQLNELPRELKLAGVQPIDTQKLSGFVSVTAEPGVSVKTATFDGLMEIPVGLLPDGNALARESGLLAFKFIAADSGIAEPWQLGVTTESVAPWVRAEVASTLTVSDTLVSGRALVRFDIQNAPVKELRLQLPAALKNVEINGANIRRRDHTGEVWRVELQNKVRGTYLLTVTWDQTREGQTNLLDLAGVRVSDVERETGTLAIVAKAPLQVSEAQATDLLKLDTHEWPQWAGAPEANAALAYRYLRPGYQLVVTAQRYSEAEVLQALAETVFLSTVVAEDGQMMTALSVAVRNNGRQHLEVVLPPGASVWSAFVAGQAVRPSLRDGKLLLPLENAGSDDAALTVELTYVSTNQNQFPAKNGSVQLISPALDVPLKNARWELYLPPDYQYDEFTGTMTREAGVTVASLAADLPQLQEEASFSVLDYSKRESDAKVEAAKEVKTELFNVQRKLAEGNVKDAANYFSRVQNRSDLTASDADAKVVEQQLRRAQASNIVQAQQEFLFRNNGRMDPQSAANVAVIADESQVGYLNAAAEQQWEKLQKAQEVALVKVRPLRVNLPTRGLRHSFTQVLQTEIGKPMTVGFQAQNTKTVNWPKRVAGGAGAFLALWVVVALVVVRTPRHGESA
jgi:prepilin-type processing-associated H-X9-DG protein